MSKVPSSADFSKEEIERWRDMENETFSPVVLTEEEFEEMRKQGKI